MTTDTIEMPFWRPRPPVPTRYDTRSRAAVLLARFLASAFVADVKKRLPLIPLWIGVFGVAYWAVLFLRGLYVAAEMLGVAAP